MKTIHMHQEDSGGILRRTPGGALLQQPDRFHVLRPLGGAESIDVALAVKEKVPRMMLAGGLTPENVAERVTSIAPWGVDVASGVEDETAGVKSAEKVRAFIKAAKGL